LQEELSCLNPREEAEAFEDGAEFLEAYAAAFLIFGRRLYTAVNRKHHL
jgi:hypothetical protein